MKINVAERVPPGDRWKLDNTVYESLTECLNQIFLERGVMYFEVDAKNGNLVWQGNGSGSLYSSKYSRDQLINNFVNKVLESFPAKS